MNATLFLRIASVLTLIHLYVAYGRRCLWQAETWCAGNRGARHDEESALQLHGVHAQLR